MWTILTIHSSSSQQGEFWTAFPGSYSTGAGEDEDIGGPMSSFWMVCENEVPQLWHILLDFCDTLELGAPKSSEEKVFSLCLSHRIRMYAKQMVCHLPSIYPRHVSINLPDIRILWVCMLILVHFIGGLLWPAWFFIAKSAWMGRERWSYGQCGNGDIPRKILHVFWWGAKGSKWWVHWIFHGFMI